MSGTSRVPEDRLAPAMTARPATGTPSRSWPHPTSRSLPAPLSRSLSRSSPRSGTPSRPTPLRPSPTVLAAAAGLFLWALVAGGFRRLTVPAELGTFVPGATLTYVALRRGCRRFRAPEHLDGRGTAGWGAVLVVFGIWELYADLRGSTPAHPTLSILMGPVLADPLHRAVGYVLWLATGVWLVRR